MIVELNGIKVVFAVYWSIIHVLVPGHMLGTMSDTSFATLKGIVSNPTLKAIAEMGFSRMTEIQAKAVPPLLEGR